MISLERPAALLFLLAPLVFAVAGRAGRIWGFSPGPGPAGDAGYLAFGPSSVLGRRAARTPFASLIHHVCVLSFWLGWCLASIAAAGPLSLRSERIFLDRGRDLVFVLDVSPSMAARDMEAEDGRGRSRPATRLAACLGLIRGLAGAGGNASLGLVAFGTEAVLVLPPTEDRAALLERLEGLSAGMEGEGTALGMGILTALYHLRGSRSPSRSIIVFTDGESNSGAVSPQRAVELCKESGVALSLVAVGRKGEAPLSWTDPQSGAAYEGSYLSDFDPAGLAELARAAGGSFALATDPLSLDAVRAELLRTSSLSGRFREGTVRKNLMAPFLVVALILLGLSWCLSVLVLEAREWP